jgi:hypothetical protein
MDYKLLSHELEGDHKSDSTKHTTAYGVDATLSNMSYVHQDKQNFRDTQLLILDHAVVASHPPANRKDNCEEKDSDETGTTEKRDKVFFHHFSMLGGIIGFNFGILSILAGVAVRFLWSISGKDHPIESMEARIIFTIVWATIIGFATLFVFVIFHATVSVSYALNDTQNCNNVKGEDNVCCNTVRNKNRTKEFPRKYVYAFEGAFLSGSLLGNSFAYNAIRISIGEVIPTSLSRVELALDYTGILFAVLVYNVYTIALGEDEEEERMKIENKDDEQHMLIV